MKTIKVIFFSLLALVLIAGTGVFIFSQIFDADQYLPQITKKASAALGRPVSIGHAGLGLSLQGITLDAGPVTIADDVNFTTQPFIKIDLVRIGLDLRYLILQRKILITNILLLSPQIHFIRSQEGNLNIRSIGGVQFLRMDSRWSLPPNVLIGGGNDRNNDVIPAKAGIQIPSGSKKISFDLVHKGEDPFQTTNIKSIKIQDAAISFIDQDQAMPLDLWLNIAGARLNIANLDIASSGTLEAAGDINMTNGVIKDFNILKTLFSHTLGILGGMEGNIDNLFNGQLKDKLGAPDTMIEKAEVKFSLHHKALFIDESLIQTNIFEFTAKGSVDQGFNMDMQTVLHLNEDVSSALISEFQGLKFLYDDSNRITIPAGIKGFAPHLKYKPDKDFRKKSKKVLIEEGGNILGVFLGARPAALQDSSSQGSGKKIKDNFKNIIKNFL